MRIRLSGPVDLIEGLSSVNSTVHTSASLRNSSALKTHNDKINPRLPSLIYPGNL